MYQWLKASTTLMVLVTFRLCSALLSLGSNSSLEYLPWDKHIHQADLYLLSYAFTLYPENVSIFSSCGYSFIPLLMTASHLCSKNFSFQTISPDIVTLTKPKSSHQKHQTSLKVHIFSKLSDVFTKEASENACVCTSGKKKKLTLNNILVDFGSRRVGNLCEEGFSLITASCDPWVKRNLPKQG